MTLTARCPEDVLAMVPVVLGFVPTESVVMLTFGARETFHARVDLPLTDEEIDAVCTSLLDPAARNGVRRVLFVVYGDERPRTTAMGRRLEREFAGAGIDVVEMLRTDAGRWYPLVGTRPGVPEWGVPYDVTGHRFSVEAVVHGRVTHGSREDLQRTLEARADQVEAVNVKMAHTPMDWEFGQIPPTAVLLAEGAWVQSLLGRHLRSGDPVSDDDLVRLLRGLSTLRVRDAAWALIERSSAENHIGFWSEVVRRTPQDWITPPATLLGWAAWQAGHGALAWCAVEVAEAGDPDYTLLGYLAHVLENAVPPSVWTPTTEWDAGLRPAG